MRTISKRVKTEFTWSEFRDGLRKAGFTAKEDHPEWMMLNTKGEHKIIAIPGEEDGSPIPGATVYNSIIHKVWFATRVPNPDTESRVKWIYETSLTFPASILS